MEKELRMWLWKRWYTMNQDSESLKLFGVWLRSQTQKTIDMARGIFEMEQKYKKDASTRK
jgi:hypothetical protein